MSYDCYARLCYGFPITDEDGNPEFGTPEFLQKFQDLADHAYDGFTDFLLYLRYPDRQDFSWEERDETTAYFNVLLATTGDSSEPQYMLVIAASLQSTDWNAPQPLGQYISPESMNSESINILPRDYIGEWRTILKNFCTTAGIWYSEPQWWLCAYSG